MKGNNNDHHCEQDLASVEEKLACRDPFNLDGGFCWRFDELFPAGSPEA